MDLCPFPPSFDFPHQVTFFFLTSCSFFHLSFLPISSGAANTDGSYHGTNEEEMVSMCFLCMSLKLSQHEPRSSTKHKHQITRCLTPGQLDLCSPLLTTFHFHPKVFFSYKEARNHYFMELSLMQHPVIMFCLCITNKRTELSIRHVVLAVCSGLGFHQG